MSCDQILLDEIVRRVLNAARPDRIILFGSAATGQMTKDSDIDLLIVHPSPHNTRDESVKIRRAVGDIGYPVDVIVITTTAIRCDEEHHRWHSLSGEQVRTCSL
jgi:uncharacterized protein